MTKLQAITPLGGTTARIDTYDGLVISENPDRALASLSARLGKETALLKTATSFLGEPLPDVGKCATQGDITAFWMGPDLWMLDAPFSSHEDLAALLKQAVGDTGSVAEQTDGWCRFDLLGTRCHDVLERLCNVNSRVMRAGDVTRTQLEHLGCFVMCTRTDSGFVVLGPRSSAKSLHHALETAARSAL